MSSFKMNPGWEREFEKIAREAVHGVANDYQKMFDSLARRYKGKPVTTIKPVLRREWRRLGGSITDPELTVYATHISEGTRIQMKVK